MKYTKEQLEKGMIIYYKNMRENPNQYSQELEYSDQQAIDCVEELLSYIKTRKELK